MSDGNYNRNLLPYRNYQSGVRAGEARMRSIALKSFESYLDKNNLYSTEEEKRQLISDFKNTLL